jgi:hypothetical protein
MDSWLTFVDFFHFLRLYIKSPVASVYKTEQQGLFYDL